MILIRRIRSVVLIVLLLATLVGTLTVATLSYGQATPNATSAIIRGFHLISPTEGWVSTDHLYWTKDSGTTWTDITPPNFNGGDIPPAIAFVDSQHGSVIVTAPDVANYRTNYSIVQTTDGGKTWATKPLNVSPEGHIASFPSNISLQFLDGHTGWLRVRQQSSSNFDTGTLFKTTDGGTTWTELNLPVDDYFKTPIGDPVVFVTDQLGWIAGRTGGGQVWQNMLYRTQDGGQTWQTETVGAVPSTPGIWRREYQLPEFVNAQDGLLTVLDGNGQGSTVEIYITHDSGVTWKLDSTLDGSGPVRLLDSTHWIGIIRGKGVAQRTITQTTTPTISSQDPVVTNIDDMDFVSSSTALALSSYQTCPANPKPGQCVEQHQLLYTSDGGQTWQQVTLPQTASGVLSTTILSGPQGFDMYCLPLPAVLERWHGAVNPAPFFSVGFYFDTLNDYCSHYAVGGNQYRTAGNILDLSQHGWSFIPIWVGPQVPGKAPDVLNTAPMAAYKQGIDAANAAADNAVLLGLGGSLIYYDFEGYGNYYNYQNYVYRTALQSLISAWTSQLHARGFKAGVYTNYGDGHISDFVNITNAPDVAWIAGGDLVGYQTGVNVFGFTGQYLSDQAWANHQRLRQYSPNFQSLQYGSQNESLSPIDADAQDGVVAVQILTPAVPPGIPAIIYPTEGLLLANTTTIITFRIQAGTPNYRGTMNWCLLVSPDPTFPGLNCNNGRWFSSPEITISGFTKGTTYHAKVLQWDGTNGTIVAPQFSLVRTFSIAP